MKPIIPKSPDCPDLSHEEIEFLTSTVFGLKTAPQTCDAIFLFSGTHPGHWEKTIEAFDKGYSSKIIVTGGRSITGEVHKDWNYADMTEAEVIIHHLLEAGIPESSIVYENKSTNTLENVIFAKDVFDFSSINTLMFICKSHATGRQWRTLTKHLPDHISYIPYTFDTVYKDVTVSRDNWMDSEIG
ncbi:YdcF family protein [Macrococcus lamae]|uniref:YdcF family protein n=1 Tax=Macrococcus lamae TaxID=198484 RepID=UPI001AA034B8|nr:YdcF family protein [Macrococcus lamae]